MVFYLCLVCYLFLLYKIIQSSGLWRQPVVSHRCRASTHERETIRLEENTRRTTDRHTPYVCILHDELNSYTTDLNTLKSTGLISVFKQLDAQNLFQLSFHFMPLHVSSTCAHHQEVKIALHSLWYHHISRPPIGVITPEGSVYNFDLLMMSTCARNM